MQIRVKQIRADELELFVLQTTSGGAFDGNIGSYVSASGWLGDTVVYTSGGTQNILGSKTFASPINIPYSGTTGQSVARLYIDDKIKRDLEFYSGFINVLYVSMTGNQSISGTKTFVSSPIVPNATSSTQAIRLN